MTRPAGKYRATHSLHRHAAKLREMGLEPCIRALPEGEFITAGLDISPGIFMLRLKADGIVEKIARRKGDHILWRRGPYWRAFIAAFDAGREEV